MPSAGERRRGKVASAGEAAEKAGEPAIGPGEPPDYPVASSEPGAPATPTPAVAWHRHPKPKYASCAPAPLSIPDARPGLGEERGGGGRAGAGGVGGSVRFTRGLLGTTLGSPEKRGGERARPRASSGVTLGEQPSAELRPRERTPDSDPDSSGGAFDPGTLASRWREGGAGGGGGAGCRARPPPTGPGGAEEEADLLGAQRAGLGLNPANKCPPRASGCPHPRLRSGQRERARALGPARGRVDTARLPGAVAQPLQAEERAGVPTPGRGCRGRELPASRFPPIAPGDAPARGSSGRDAQVAPRDAALGARPAGAAQARPGLGVPQGVQGERTPVPTRPRRRQASRRLGRQAGRHWPRLSIPGRAEAVRSGPSCLRAGSRESPRLGGGRGSAGPVWPPGGSGGCAPPAGSPPGCLPAAAGP